MLQRNLKQLLSPKMLSFPSDKGSECFGVFLIKLKGTWRTLRTDNSTTHTTSPQSTTNRRHSNQVWKLYLIHLCVNHKLKHRNVRNRKRSYESFDRLRPSSNAGKTKPARRRVRRNGRTTCATWTWSQTSPFCCCLNRESQNEGKGKRATAEDSRWYTENVPETL